MKSKLLLLAGLLVVGCVKADQSQSKATDISQEKEDNLISMANQLFAVSQEPEFPELCRLSELEREAICKVMALMYDCHANGNCKKRLDEIDRAGHEWVDLKIKKNNVEAAITNRGYNFGLLHNAVYFVNAKK